jgi:hypothetical protein
MNMETRTRFVLALLCLLAAAPPAAAQQTSGPQHERSLLSQLFMRKFGAQDVTLLVSGFEWGAPDRWSFTSRYVHMFQTDRDHKRMLHNFTATLSPGLAGARLGAGYQNVSFGLLSEARAVLLRTWREPITADPNRTFAGVELRTSLTGVASAGVGWYTPVGTAPASRKAFVGLHVGVGM